MILKNALVFYEGAFERLDIRVANGRIEEIGEALEGEEEIDLEGKKIVPGVIDVHTHGCLGFDFTIASCEEMKQMETFYLEQGVTSILATVMTMQPSYLEAAMTNIHRIMSEEGSVIKGINMEGPFLGEDKKGAHDPLYLQGINGTFFEKLDAACKGQIKLVNIDPKLSGAMAFIETYSDSKTVSMAHTSADYALAEEAVKKGAHHITHLFNAMNGLHHREPGLIGAFSDFDVNAELICDGVHVHPSVVRMCFKIAPEKLVIISDSISATGLKPGKYVSGGLAITVEKGEARLENGTIAGSTATAFEGMRRAIKFGVAEEQAILAATLNAAKSVGLDEEIGSIAKGKYADLLIVNEAYELEGIYKNGKKIK